MLLGGLSYVACCESPGVLVGRLGALALNWYLVNTLTDLGVLMTHAAVTYAECPPSFTGYNATATCSGLDNALSPLAGDTCDASCDDAYDGDMTLQCGSDGVWTVKTGACIKSKAV